MTLTILNDLEQGSDEWLDQRRGIVTASVVGQLITTRNLSAIDFGCPSCDALATSPCLGRVKRIGEAPTPIKTLHTERADVARRDQSPPVIEPASNDYSRALTATLVAERIAGYTETTYVNFDMQRGIDDEPRARDRYAEHYRQPVTETGFMVRDDWGYKIGYSPDGLVGDDGLIEVKSRKPKKHLQTILADRVPFENMAQLQCGLLVSGREWVDYISYCGGMPMWVKRVTPDPRWVEAIVSAVETFETTAAEMVATYTQATKGLAQTERALEMEMIL